MIRLLTAQLANKTSLGDILGEEDDLGLLDVQPLKAKAAPTDLTGAQFAEITAFYERHGRLPDEGSSAQLDEKLLARRLKGMLANPAQCEHLQAQDQFGLLTPVVNGLRESRLTDESDPEPEPVECVNQSELVTSLADIFADDDDGLLDFDEPNIFSLRHISAEKKEQPDEIAQRQPCADFTRFSPLFVAFHQGVQDKTFSLVRFAHKLKIAAGDFFILNGVLGYVVSVGERLAQYAEYNARLHLVFENGTEMQMLYLSLTHGLVRDKEGRKGVLHGRALLPSAEPVPTGVVYILKSLSTDPAIAA
ncbi:MAG: GIY-YIG nuclease family protein, partial [Aeromonas sp.]